jgi:hypothetical protein
VASPNGGYAIAAKRIGTGAWDLLTFAALAGAPQTLPLEAVPGDIQSISMAPDGQLMAMVNDLSKMKTDAPQPPEGSASSAQQEPQGEAETSTSGGQAVRVNRFLKGAIWNPPSSGTTRAERPVHNFLCRG